MKVQCDKFKTCKLKNSCHWAKPHEQKHDLQAMKRSCDSFYPVECERVKKA